jgi:predicted phosphohydrolase
MVVVQYLSDIHTEFMSVEKVQSDLLDKIHCVSADGILVLAGDIGNPHLASYRHFLNGVSAKFKKVFLIAGNHEYYGGTTEAGNNKIQEIAANCGNVSFLNNTYEDYEGFRWIGTTLWSRIHSMKSVRAVRDFRKIVGHSIEGVNAFHNEAVEFIKSTVGKSPIQCIVITHHMPSLILVDEKYKFMDNTSYASSQDNLIKESDGKICAWFYGHTHTPNTGILIHNTMTYSNPYGYEGENPDAILRINYSVKV